MSDETLRGTGLTNMLYSKTYAELFGTFEINEEEMQKSYEKSIKKWREEEERKKNFSSSMGKFLFDHQSERLKLFGLINEDFKIKLDDKPIFNVSNDNSEDIDDSDFNLEDLDNMDFLSTGDNLEAEVKQTELDPDYSLAIIDKSLLIPILYDKTVFNNVEVKKLIKEASTYDSKLEKAKVIFNWMNESLSYDHNFKQNSGKYRTAVEVLRDKKGVCGELSFLYIVLARRSGLKSNYVHVDRDYKGENVNHACAAVNIDENIILVDPANCKFDVKHKGYDVLDDNQLFHRFSLMRFR